MLDQAESESADRPAGPSVQQEQQSAGTFRALQHRNYRLYFAGQFISLMGSWMQTPALSWLAYELTRQSRWVSWIIASQLLPTFVLGFWGGSLADRWSRRGLLFATQTLLLLLPLVLILFVEANVTSPWPFLAVSTMTGLVLAVDFPARLVFVMDMVGRDDLPNAVALNALMFNAARLIGPLLGGLVLEWSGPALCFWLNSVSYLAVLVALMYMDGMNHSARGPGGARQELGGFAHVLNAPKLLLILLLAGLMGFCGWPFMGILPALVSKALQAPRFGYTLLLSATGLGALASAWAVATFTGPRRSRYFVAAGVGLACLGLLGLSQAERLGHAFGSCFMIGFGLVMFFSTGQAMMQLGAGEHNRGQVMGIWAMVVSGAQPLGNLIAGPAADELGERFVLAVLAVLLGVAATLAIVVFAIWRRSD